MSLKVRQTVISKPKRQSHTTIEEFIFAYLGDKGKAYVHEMLNAYNARHLSNKPAKYTSFRTIVWNLKDDGVIVPTEPPRWATDSGGFPKSYYTLTGKPLVKKTKKVK